MDDKRLLVAALASLGVLILWQFLFPPPEPPPPVDPIASQVAAVEPEERADREEVASAAVAEAAGEPGEVSTSLVEEVDGEAAESLEAIAATHEETVVVEENGRRAVFSNRGAQLISFELLKHQQGAEGEHVDLVRRRDDGTYPFALSDGNDRPSPFNDLLFVHQRGTDSQGRQSVEFRSLTEAGEVVKSFVFRGDGLIELVIEVSGENRWGFLLGPGIRNPSPRELEDRFARRSGVYLASGKVETIDAQGADEATILPGRGVGWFGLQDAYFLTAILPENAPDNIVFLPTLVRTLDGTNAMQRIDGEVADMDDELTRELELVVYPGTESFQAVAYFGSKKYDRLADLGYSLEKTVSLGIFSFLARPLLFALLWIYDHVVANYGWAIVLLTFVVRLVLFPLTHKSTVSMRKMQALNPQIQAIRQKFRSKLKDKKGRPNAEAQRKMNEEIMGLYKTEGVNPAGGCLPILLQMPVLFAFYSLLSAAVELRNAPWILWIQDLSAPDPYYVLPIVMGASQFVQQKLMPAGGDPMQRRIMMLMPVFFTVLFLNFASGLVLYWLTSNLLTIAQTAVTNKLLPQESSGSSQKSHKKGSSR